MATYALAKKFTNEQIIQKATNSPTQKITFNSGIYSLPSNVVNGQVSDVVIKGQTWTNLLNDLVAKAEDISLWTDFMVNSVIDNSEQYSGNGCLKVTLAPTRVFGSAYIDASSIINPSKYYLASAYLKNGNLTTGIKLRAFLQGGSMPESVKESEVVNTTTYKRVGIVLQPSDFIDRTTIFLQAAVSGLENEYGFIDNFMLMEITAEEYNNLSVDQLMQKYHFITGTKSTNSVRLRSVGKNLFDGELENGEYSTETGEKQSNSSTYRSVNKFRVIAGQSYTLSADTAAGYRFFYYDEFGNFISTELKTVLPATFTPPNGTKKVSFHSASINSGNYLSVSIQVEEGTTTTTYEPYKESIVYINTGGELRSLPNGTKDEISIGQNGTVKTQNVSAPFIVNGDLPWKYYGDKIGSKLCYLEDITVFCPNIKRVTSYSYPGTFVLRDKNNATVAEMGSGSKDGVHEFQLPLGSSGIRLYVNIPDTLSGWAEDVTPTIQQIKDYFNANPYALTYQLAQPIVTQIPKQKLEVFENGTVYVEPLGELSETTLPTVELEVPVGQGNQFGIASHDYEAASADWVLNNNESKSILLSVTNAGAAANIIAPDRGGKAFVVVNNSGYGITIKKSGGTGVTVTNGKTVWVIHNGTDYTAITAEV